MTPKYYLWWDGWCVGVKEWQTNHRLRHSKAQAKWVANLQKTLELHVPSKDPDLSSPKVPPVYFACTHLQCPLLHTPAKKKSINYIKLNNNKKKSNIKNFDQIFQRIKSNQLFWVQAPNFSFPSSKVNTRLLVYKSSTRFRVYGSSFKVLWCFSSFF